MSSVSSFKDHNSLSERTEFIDNDLSQVQHNQKGNNIHLPKQNLHRQQNGTHEYSAYSVNKGYVSNLVLWKETFFLNG